MDFIAFAVTLLATLPILALMKAVMSRRIQKYMLAESQDIGVPPPLLEEREEIPASTKPKIDVVSAAVFGRESDPHKIIGARQSIAAETLKSTNTFWRRLWRHEVLASLSYIAFPLIIGLVGGRTTVPVLDVVFSAGLLTIAIWMISSSRLVVKFLLGQYRKTTFRKPRGIRWFDRTRRSLWLILFGWFEVVLHPLYGFVAFSAVALVWGAVMYNAHIIGGLQLGALILAICCHGYLIRRAYRQPDKTTNRRLLILRVFDIDRSAFLTFDFLLSYWRHFGSSFTVIDPAYLRYQYRGVSSRNVAVTFWTLYVIQALLVVLWLIFGGSLYYYLQPDAYLFLVEVFALVDRLPIMGFIVAMPFAIVAVIVGYLVAFAVIYYRAPDSFAKNSDQIAGRIDTLMASPQKPDRTFKDLHMYCFDNTWRIAVAEFVTKADVVLMDLRGFSADRKGCEYEVDFLFDSISLDQIVFVADATGTTAIDDVRELIFQRWEHLRQGSPNLGLTDPKAKVFVVGDQSSKDVQALADHLMAASTHTPILRSK